MSSTTKSVSAVLLLVGVAGSSLLWAGAASAAPDAASTTPDMMRIARGAKAWTDNCGRCHNYRDPKEFSDKNWDVIVTHMRTLAPLPGAVARDIKAFLKASN